MTEPTLTPDLDVEWRSKYTADELGQAFKNENGDWSYPIKTEDDAKKAIRAVGRGGADHDAIRKYIIKACKKIGCSDLIPDAWNADGSLKESESAWADMELRETANDMFVALEGAVEDAYPDYGSYYTWVQDWWGSPDEGWRVLYQAGNELLAAPFSFDDDNKIMLGKPVKVRPITCYVERSDQHTAAWGAREQRKAKAEMLQSTFERRDWQTAFGSPEIEIRAKNDGLTWVGGYASVTEHGYDVGYYEEIVDCAAFNRTLSEKPDTIFLVNHGGTPLARTTTNSLELEAPKKGLRYDAGLQPHDPDVLSIIPKLERKDLSESSFAFLVRDQEWDADFTKRRILDVSLHKGDVSVVNYGANPAASAGMRALRAVGSVDDLIGALLELRAGKALSTANEEALTRVLALVAGADENVDEAQPLLARVLGVESPDDEDSERALVPSSVSIARARRARLMAGV